jgi:anti-anti-sigma factor
VEQPHPHTFVLSVHGEADLHVVAKLRDRLADAIDQDPSLVVLDLTGSAFIDSTAIAVLLRAMKQLHARGGRLRVVVPRSDLRRIFELTQLDRVFTLAASRQEALGDANGGPREVAAPL